MADDVNDSLRAAYRCTRGHTWATWWDRQAAGWLLALAALAAVVGWLYLNGWTVPS